jgi:succinate dehydrogenase / fumarate reductase iron-sulfur subunit
MSQKIWRENAQDKGANRMVDYEIDGIEPDMSFLKCLTHLMRI